MANSDDGPRYPGGTGVRDDVTADVGERSGSSDFDVDDERETGRDSLRVHVGWEIVLLLAAGAVGALLFIGHRSAVSGGNLRELLVFAAAVGLLATAAGMSLRAGVPNLALGPVAVASGYFLVTHADRGLAATAGVTALLALGGGVAIGLVVAVLHVPGWAASLAGGLAVAGWVVATHGDPVKVDLSYDPRTQAVYWFAAFAGTSILAGLLGTVRPIRSALGRNRPTADPALRRGGSAAFIAFLALAVSTLLAGVGGMVLAMGSAEVPPNDGFALTGLALGAALLGGTSVFGRRGGVFGTVLAVLLIVLVIRYVEALDWRVSRFTVAGAAVAVGLLISRLVEALGTPADDDSDDGPDPLFSAASTSTTGTWSTPEQPGWTSQLPARQIDDTWAGDQRWGNR
ncbi:MAG TPA: ABC transporter permease [Micromonosporaceae bacterium]